MSKPILRVGKIKKMGTATAQSVQGHLARSRQTPNADPSRTPQNRWLVDPGKSLENRIRDVMKKAGIDPDALRKDATIANDVLLSISPEWFRPDDPEARGTYDPKRLEIFQAEAEAFLKKTFGVRLVAAVLHLDEATPHIQAVVVPVMKQKDGNGWRLSGKDMFNPTSLGRLQQDWEDRLQPHGVGHRLKGSKARHTTLREYYGALDETRQNAVSTEPTDPPIRGRVESETKYQNRLKDWKKAEEERLQPLKVQAAQGRLHEAERLAAQQLRGEVAEKSRQLGEAYEQISLDKEQISALRKTPLNAVAAELGYAGEVWKKENAIDLVKRVGELSYNDAVQWLAQRFGASVAATAVREAALPELKAAEAGKPVFTPAEVVKVKALREQLTALSAPFYRLTVMDVRDGKKVAQNLGKSPDGGPERFWTAQEVLGKIPELTRANARGGNIFITPIDDAVRHVLIDDLKPPQLDELRQRGYQPALVLETSPQNFQAVVKVPAALEKDASNEWFKDLNRDLGDEKITGLVHPMRLAGFQNRKEKHQTADEGRRPFVRVVEAVNRMCSRAVAVIRQYGLEARHGSIAERGDGLAPRR
jgi:hypothetical protein